MKVTQKMLDAKIATAKSLTGLNIGIQTAYGGKKLVLINNRTGAQIELGYERMTSSECSNALEILINTMTRVWMMPEDYVVENSSEANS